MESRYGILNEGLAKAKRSNTKAYMSELILGDYQFPEYGHLDYGPRSGEMEFKRYRNFNAHFEEAYFNL